MRLPTVKSKASPIIIAIGGGKGGIGKSFVTANIATRMAMLGFRVAAVDLDLGAANLHSCLGIPQPPHGIGEFFSGAVRTLEAVGVSHPISRLTLYGGNQVSWQQVKPYDEHKIRLINALKDLDVDYVFLDLGAGTHVHTLDFFIFSDAGLITITPEPTSIENAYVFMKSILYRKVQNVCHALEINKGLEKEILKKIASVANNSTPFDELKKFQESHPEINSEIFDFMRATNVGIIMNQVRTNEDKDLGRSLSVICNKYFGFCANYVGSLRNDDAVWRSLRMRKILILENPHSLVANNIYNLVDEIIKKYEPLRQQSEIKNVASF